MKLNQLFFACSLILVSTAFANPLIGSQTQDLLITISGPINPATGFNTRLPGIKLDVSCALNGPTSKSFIVEISGVTSADGSFDAGQMPIPSQCTVKARSSDGHLGTDYALNFLGGQLVIVNTFVPVFH